jgi:branched-chain amino acid transport system substrate-binding protein
VSVHTCRSHVIIVTVALVTSLTAACRSAPTSTTRPASTLTIGLMAPSSGPNAATGRQAAQGAQLAMEIVNDVYNDLPLPLAEAAGLRDGARIAIAPVDTAGDVGAVGGKLGELVGPRHAAAVLVVDSAEVVSAATQQNEALQIPLLDAATSADYLTELSRNWYFRLSPPDRVYAQTALGLLRQVQSTLPSVHRVALLEGTSTVNGNAGTSVRTLLESSGYEVVLRRPMAQGAPALTELQDQLALVHPDVVFAVAATAPDAAVLAELANQQHGTVPVIALGRGVGGLPASPSAGQSPGVLRIVSWSSDLANRNPLARSVGDLFQRRFGTAMTDVAASAFTAVLTLAAAADAASVGTAGGANPARIRAALRQLRLTATELIMPWEGVRFSASGQNDLATGVVEQQLAGGFQVVFPRELAAAAIGWPGVG